MTTPRCRATSSGPPASRTSTATRPQGRRGHGRRLPAERLPHLRRRLPRRPPHLGETEDDGITRPQRRRRHRRPRLVELQHRLDNPTHMVMKAGRVWAWDASSGRATSSTPPGLSPLQREHEAANSGAGKPKVALDPADPSLDHVADWQPAEAAPASFVRPTSLVPPTMTLQPGVYYDGDEFSTKLNVRQRHAEPRRLLPQLPRRQGRMALDKNVVGPACDVSGQGVQIVFADSAHIKLSGTLTLPCGRMTSTGPNIALYGLKTDIAGPGAQSYTLRPTGATSTTMPAFAPLPATITTAARLTRRTERPQTLRSPRTRRPRSWRPDSTNRGSPVASRSSCESRTERTTTRHLRAHSSKQLTARRAPRLDPATEHGHRDERRELPGFNAVAPFEVTYSVQAGNQSVNASLEGSSSPPNFPP